MRSLTITHLEDLYAHLRRSGRHDGGPLAPKTVLNVHQILRILAGSTRSAPDWCTATSARLMNPPCHGVAPEQRCWNEHDLRVFLDVAIRIGSGRPCGWRR